MNTHLRIVHVRINDAATGQPTPVRIRFTGSDGQTISPLGRDAASAQQIWNAVYGGQVVLDGRVYAHIDGTCEIPVASSTLHVAIAKGPEYRPLESALNLGSGKLGVRLAIERWTDLRAQGWYSGDSGAFLPTPHAALVEGAAEDVAVVNLLCAETPVPGEASQSMAPNLLAFSGQAPALERSGHLVVVNSQNRHAVLGSLSLLNSHRLICPLRFGAPGRLDDWTLADWCDQCHRKGGLVVWARRGGWPESPPHPWGEALADLLLGKIDALEMDPAGADRTDLLDWYQLLNAGLRVPLVAGSGKASSDRVLGRPRTYARLAPGQPLTYANWIEAVRAGRTFVTHAPLVWLDVEGHGPGESYPSTSARPFRIRSEARGRGYETLELVADGETVAAASAQGETAAAVIETEWSPNEVGWVAARCVSGKPGGPVTAHTSPVYIEMDGPRPQRREEARRALVGPLNEMLRWVQTGARCSDETQRQRLAAPFEAARRVALGE